MVRVSDLDHALTHTIDAELQGAHPLAILGDHYRVVRRLLLVNYLLLRRRNRTTQQDRHYYKKEKSSSDHALVPPVQ
jgi:hypothetical protein